MTRFSRRALGSLFALAFVAACSPKGPKQYLPPSLPDKPVIDSDNTEYFNPKADILFVVDNSGSMDTHQATLAANIGQFINTFLTGSVLDYHISVVSTDMEGFGPIAQGRFAGSIRVVGNTTPNATTVLRQNLLLGIDGSGNEMVFDPIVTALSPPLINTYNQGFLRPDAHLIVIFLTDAEDQSRTYTARSTYDFLVNLKGGHKDKILGFGAIIPSSAPDCGRDTGAPYKIEEFLRYVITPFGPNVANLCDATWGTSISNFASQIVAQVSSVIYLSRPPEPNSIKVQYGSIFLPKDIDKGWSFDVYRNAVVLGKDVDWDSQPPGSKVQVFYNATQYQKE